MTRKNLYSQPLVVLGYALYGAVVAGRVGGGWLEIGVALVLGAIAGLIHYGTTRSRLMDLQTSFLAGLVGTLVAIAGSTFLPPFDIARAVFGGMTLLVPAMVITIATHELACDALESGTIRLVYGLLRFLMLGLGGVCAVQLGKWILGVPSFSDATGTPTPLPAGTVVELLILGGCALVVCLQGRVRDAPWMIGAVLLAYVAQKVSVQVVGAAAAPFLAAFALGIVAQLQALLPRHFPATMLVPGLLQLAPGFLGVESVLNLLRGEGPKAQTFFHVSLVALQLVTGLILAGVLVRRRRRGPLTPIGSHALAG